MTPARVRKVKTPSANAEADGLEEPDLKVGKRKGLCWAKRLKRVFNIKKRCEHTPEGTQSAALVGGRLGRSDEDDASRIVAESWTTALKLRL